MDPQQGNVQERRHSQDLSGQNIRNGSQEIKQKGSSTIMPIPGRGSNDIQYKRRSQDDQEKSSNNYGGKKKSQDSHGSQSFQNIRKIQESQERRTEQRNSKGSSPEAQIKFYSQFAEKAVYNLKDVTDKALAARWILFLERQPISVVRAEYLKQLLFLCLHGRLAGVFVKPPAESIVQLPEHHTIQWLAEQALILRRKDQIPIQQEISESRTEYLAVQNIPYFGTHLYFAISDEPIDKWENTPAESEFTEILK